jgi:hypothetical protein
MKEKYDAEMGMQGQTYFRKIEQRVTFRTDVLKLIFSAAYDNEWEQKAS